MRFLSLTPFPKSTKESALANMLTHRGHVLWRNAQANTCITASSRAPEHCCSLLQHSTSLCSPLPFSPPPRHLALCHLAVLGGLLLAPVCPRGCAFQHLWPHSILPCFPGEKGLAWLEAPCLLRGAGAVLGVLRVEFVLALKRHYTSSEQSPGHQESMGGSKTQPSALRALVVVSL